jgi:death-on-curing protein
VKEPVWVLRSVIEAVHEAQLAEHGGASGLLDPALLESALARPLNLRAYGQGDICMLAAAYASGIVRNHPFIDGNKRTGFLAAYVFLRLNGLDLTASEASAAEVMLALASGEMSEDEFAGWLRNSTAASAGGP